MSGVFIVDTSAKCDRMKTPCPNCYLEKWRGKRMTSDKLEQIYGEFLSCKIPDKKFLISFSGGNRISNNYILFDCFKKMVVSHRTIRRNIYLLVPPNFRIHGAIDVDGFVNYLAEIQMTVYPIKHTNMPLSAIIHHYQDMVRAAITEDIPARYLIPADFFNDESTLLTLVNIPKLPKISILARHPLTQQSRDQATGVYEALRLFYKNRVELDPCLFSINGCPRESARIFRPDGSEEQTCPYGERCQLTNLPTEME